MPSTNTYSSKQVASIIGVSESRVRYWAQTGFVGPSDKADGRVAYSFADLISVKAAKELIESGVSLQRARKSVTALKALLPQINRPLAELRIVSNGDEIIVRDREGSFEPVTGQVVMDFRVDTLTGSEVTPIVERPTTDVGHHAYVALLEGLELEKLGDEEGARVAYERARAADPSLSAAHTNLGTLCFRAGQLGEARAHYEAALLADPAEPEARFNLGNVLQESGAQEEAISAWYQVITECPEFAAAHFNLAAAFSSEGAYGPARAHLYRFLALEPKGRWADEATRALSALTPAK